jgi:RNA polymerase sigma-70 factor (ECF subfamily)
LLDDTRIYSLLLDDPEKGIEKLMDKYMAFVYTIVSGKLALSCKRQDIEECVSDVFYKVYRTRAGIDPEKGSIKSYLAVLAKRTAIDAFRKLHNTSGEISFDEYGCERIASGTDIEKEAAESETGDRLIEGIKALGEPDSQILIRKYYFGQSAKTISKALGMRENTINKRASRALTKLKASLGGVM